MLAEDAGCVVSEDDDRSYARVRSIRGNELAIQASGSNSVGDCKGTSTDCQDGAAAVAASARRGARAGASTRTHVATIGNAIVRISGLRLSRSS
eukprot:6201912-Pleurochrysis_carterae.AAC.4